MRSSREVGAPPRRVPHRTPAGRAKNRVGEFSATGRGDLRRAPLRRSKGLRAGAAGSPGVPVRTVTGCGRGTRDGRGRVRDVLDSRAVLDSARSHILLNLGAHRMPTAAVGSMPDARSPRRLAPALWALLALFVLRVSGQALVAFLGVPWLPPMREWYSGLLAYPLLLPSQLLIILV